MRALGARFDIVAQGKTYALQHRAVQVKAAVVQVEPDKTTLARSSHTGLRSPIR